MANFSMGTLYRIRMGEDSALVVAMMRPADLARFLKEEVPRIKKHAAEFSYKDALRSDEAGLLSALDAAVGLLRQCKDVLDTMRPFGNAVHLGRDALLATLRLVVGEKETQ